MSERLTVIILIYALYIVYYRVIHSTKVCQKPEL